jgi:hypothetical protein
LKSGAEKSFEWTYRIHPAILELNSQYQRQLIRVFSFGVWRVAVEWGEWGLEIGDRRKSVLQYLVPDGTVDGLMSDHVTARVLANQRAFKPQLYPSSRISSPTTPSTTSRHLDISASQHLTISTSTLSFNLLEPSFPINSPTTPLKPSRHLSISISALASSPLVPKSRQSKNE